MKGIYNSIEELPQARNANSNDPGNERARSTERAGLSGDAASAIGQRVSIPSPGLNTETGKEASSGVDPSLLPANRWKYDYPCFFRDEDNCSSQAYSQELGEYYDMECIIECSLAKGKKEQSMLWYVHWTPNEDGDYPDNEWVDTDSLRHCRNALIFFLAMLTRSSSRFKPAMRDIERCGLFTRKDFKRYCRLNGAMIHYRRKALIEAQYREEELLYGKKSDDPVQSPQPAQPPQPVQSPQPSVSSKRDQLIEQMVELWADERMLDLPNKMSSEERQIKILESIISETMQSNQENPYGVKVSRKCPKH